MHVYIHSVYTCVHVTFTTAQETCPPTLDALRIPQAGDAKYLGLCPDLNWTKLERTDTHQAKTIWISSGKNVLAR